MKIVAILEVNDKFKDEEHQYPLDEVVDKFLGYYDYPTGDKETVIVTKNSMYGTFGIETHTFNFGTDI